MRASVAADLASSSAVMSAPANCTGCCVDEEEDAGAPVAGSGGGDEEEEAEEDDDESARASAGGERASDDRASNDRVASATRGRAIYLDRGDLATASRNASMTTARPLQQRWTLESAIKKVSME